MEYAIHTIGGFDTFVAVFNQVAALLRSDGGSIYAPLVKMATAVSIFYGVAYAIYGGQLRQMGIWFVSHFLILNFLFMPLASVVIKDSMTNQVDKVDNIPFGLAFIASRLSEIGFGITRATEQVFQPSPRYGSGHQKGMVEGDFDALCYTRTGFVFGAYALAQMKSMHIADDDLADNIHEFVNQCVVYDVALGNKYTLRDLKNSDDIWGLVSQKASKIRGFAWREVPRHNGVISGAPDTRIITCAQGVEKINQIWSETTRSALSQTTESLLNFFGINHREPGSDALAQHMSSHLPGALDRLTGFSTNANDRIRQQIMISSVVKANQLKTVELGGSPNFDVRRAYLQQRSAYKTIGETVAQTLPYLKNILEALIYCLFIFVLPLSLLPQGWRVVSFWAKLCCWIQLWPPLFAILNFFVTQSMASQVMNRVSSAGGFTLANFVGVENAAADMAAIAGYLCSMIPVLSWALIEKGGYAFVNMAGSLLSVSQGAASSAASEGFAGNYNFGNIITAGVQADNRSLLKNDYSASYSSGHFAMNDGISSRMISGDGEQLINVQTSNLPVSVHRSSYQEQTLRDAYNNALSTNQSESQMASESKMSAARDFVDFSRQASNHLASNKQWTNQETANFVKDSGTVYNKLEQIQEAYGISKEMAFHAALDVSAGVDIGNSLVGKMVGVSGGVRVNESQSSTGTNRSGVDQITQLAKSNEFRSAVSHATEYGKSRNFDMGDQNLKQSVQSFGDHYEQSKQHQKNANVALERSQGLSHQIDYVRANSQRIDTVENQRFAAYAAEKLGGYDKLEEVVRKDLGRLHDMGVHYLETHYGSASLSVTEERLEADYRKKAADMEKNNQINPNFERAENLSAQNHVSRNRVLDNGMQLQAIQNEEAVRIKLGWDEADRKREMKIQAARAKYAQNKHIEDELGLIQQGTAKEMHQRHVKNVS